MISKRRWRERATAAEHALNMPVRLEVTVLDGHGAALTHALALPRGGPERHAMTVGGLLPGQGVVSVPIEVRLL